MVEDFEESVMRVGYGFFLGLVAELGRVWAWALGGGSGWMDDTNCSLWSLLQKGSLKVACSMYITPSKQASNVNVAKKPIVHYAFTPLSIPSYPVYPFLELVNNTPN